MKILVAIPKPSNSQPDTQAQWATAIQDAKNNIASDNGLKDFEWLGESAVLLLSENGLPCLGYVISAAQNKKLPYRVLFLEESADWKYVPPVSQS